MGKSQRVKGRAGEQEVARIFRAAGFDIRRVPNSGGLDEKGDLKGLDGYHLEVKRQETITLPAWLKQAESEATEDEAPTVIFRRSREPWRVVIPLDVFIKLVGGKDDNCTCGSREGVPEK